MLFKGGLSFNPPPLFHTVMAKVWRHPAAVAGVPLIAGTLPWLGAGLSFIGNPRAFLEKTRAAVGDTFVLYIFGFR